jgi:hypothetical protein
MRTIDFLGKSKRNSNSSSLAAVAALQKQKAAVNK